MGSRQYALADQDGLVLVGIEGLYPQGTKLSHEQLNEGVPIHDGIKHVGTLLAQKRNIVYTQAEQHFLDRTGKGLLWALLITVILAALFGFLLSRSLTKPVVELTKAAQNLAGGALGETVDVRSSDELGELSTVFNKMSAELEHSDRMRKQMTADIAHDLRTPLTVIGGYIESMRDGDLEPTRERLSLIYSEILRLNRLVDDLRFLSQSDSGNLPMNVAPLDANELLEQSREIFKLKVQEKGLSLELDLQENLPLIVGDESRLMQVLENLVGNAIRHSQQGGTIRLSTRHACVKFTVADNGVGIPAESLPYVFERFHRADKSRHADESQSGLGLAIVKAIVLAHGGEVWVESEVGKGSSFHFCIPTQG
jgi:signal transduction histidine kinase